MPRMSKKKQAKAMEKLLRNVTRDVDPATLWEIVGDLGEGSFGMVHKVKRKTDGRVAAAKVIPIKYDEELEDFVVEVSGRGKGEEDACAGAGAGVVVVVVSQPPTPLGGHSHRMQAPGGGGAAWRLLA